MAFYTPRNISPADQVLFDADGNAVGIQAAGSSSQPVLGFNPTKHAAIDSLVSGAGIDVAFTRAHDLVVGAFVLDAGSGNVMPVMRVTVNAGTDVIAATRISAGGTNTFQTTISGASTTGEIIPISVGSGTITSVHVGSSAGASQTVDADGTATVNELAKWLADEADDCNLVYVRFGPPRSSGRYVDVSIVGKQRG